MSREAYDVTNCQSLFGYAQEVHERSGGTCQLCGAGAGSDISFDLWRQLTVEHLIGKSQGGHYEQIKTALRRRFPDMPTPAVDDLAWKIELKNMITACNFCNSMTSRVKHDVTMQGVIESAPDSPRGLMKAVEKEARRALALKRSEVEWKLSWVRDAFEAKVLPRLRLARAAP